MTGTRTQAWLTCLLVLFAIGASALAGESPRITDLKVDTPFKKDHPDFA